ncbi:MAG: hypothetical protein RKH07_01670 [Gammaproteobacteria bacterium]
MNRILMVVAALTLSLATGSVLAGGGKSSNGKGHDKDKSSYSYSYFSSKSYKGESKSKKSEKNSKGKGKDKDNKHDWDNKWAWNDNDHGWDGSTWHGHDKKGHGHGHCKKKGKGHYKDKHHGWNHDCGDDEPEEPVELTCTADITEDQAVEDVFQVDGETGNSTFLYTKVNSITYSGMVCGEDEFAALATNVTLDIPGEELIQQCTVDTEQNVFSDLMENETNFWYDMTVVLNCANPVQAN